MFVIVKIISYYTSICESVNLDNFIMKFIVICFHDINNHRIDYSFLYN